MPAIASVIEEVGGIILTLPGSAIALKRPTGVVDNFLTWDAVQGDVTISPPVGSAVGGGTRNIIVEKTIMSKNIPEAIRIVAGVSGVLGTAEWIAWYRNDNATRRALLGYQSDNDPYFWINCPASSIKVDAGGFSIQPTTGGALLYVFSADSNAVLYLRNNLAGGHSSILFQTGALSKWGLGMGTGTGTFNFDFYNYVRNANDGQINSVTGRLTWNTGIDAGANVAASQTNAIIRIRNYPNSLEFGHTNPAGFGSTIGAEPSTGSPFIAFCAEGSTTTANTYMTRGIAGSLIRYNLANGSFEWCTLASSNADSQTPTVRMALAIATGTLNVGNLNINGAPAISGALANYTQIVAPSGNNKILIGNSLIPTIFYETDTHSFYNAAATAELARFDGSAGGADYTALMILLNTGVLSRVRFSVANGPVPAGGRILFV